MQKVTGGNGVDLGFGVNGSGVEIVTNQQMELK